MEAWRTTKARNRWPPRAGGGGRHVACGSPLTRRCRRERRTQPATGLAPSASRSGFERYLRTLAGVLGAWRVTGDVDYELLIACSAIADVEGELICLRCYGGTEVSSVGLVLREVCGPGTARRLVRRAGAADRPAALRAAGRAGLYLGGGVAVGAGPRPALDPAPRRRYA